MTKRKKCGKCPHVLHTYLRYVTNPPPPFESHIWISVSSLHISSVRACVLCVVCHVTMQFTTVRPPTLIFHFPQLKLLCIYCQLCQTMSTYLLQTTINDISSLFSHLITQVTPNIINLTPPTTYVICNIILVLHGQLCFQ